MVQPRIDERTPRERSMLTCLIMPRGFRGTTMLLCKLCLSIVLAPAINAPIALPSPQPETTTPRPTIVYIVRHAEESRSDPVQPDPTLSTAGVTRSDALAAALRDVSMAAVFATEFKRTQQMAQPTAKAHGLEVTIASARDPAGLAAQISRDFRGRTVLVVGHSNTVPAVLKAMGVATPPPLAESDYDDLFIATLIDGEPTTMQHLHYGAPNMTGQTETQLGTQTAGLLDRFHDAAAKADEDRYFACFEPGALFLGTDAGERWTIEEFKAFAIPYFQGESAWIYTPVKRTINVSQDGAYAWFDEQLDSASYGRCRGTGLLHRTGDQWRIAQYHLSIPIPNDVAGAVVKLIREHAGKGK